MPCKCSPVLDRVISNLKNFFFCKINHFFVISPPEVLELIKLPLLAVHEISKNKHRIETTLFNWIALWRNYYMTLFYNITFSWYERRDQLCLCYEFFENILFELWLKIICETIKDTHLNFSLENFIFMIFFARTRENIKVAIQNMTAYPIKIQLCYSILKNSFRL